MKTLALLLLLIVTAVALAKAPKATTVIVSMGGGSADTLNAISVKGDVFVSLSEISEKLPITILRPQDLPLLILSTSANSVPVYVLDSTEYRSQDEKDYVQTGVIAEACQCAAMVKKKQSYLVCGDLSPIETGGEVNSVAPGFQLLGADSLLSKSEDLFARGPLVLAFVRSGFWEPLSRDILTRLDANMETFAQENASVAAITGYFPEEIRGWKDSVTVSFPILADNGIATMYAYEVHYQGKLPYPTVFVIDSSGVIRYRENFDGLEEAPDMSRIVKAVKELNK